MTSDPRYPIGRFAAEGEATPARRATWIADVAACPRRLAEAVAGLSDAQLDTPYRDGGWTVRQLVHHVPESHLNAYVRFKLALTEQEPTIKPYDEARWAELPDVAATPVAVSLHLLEALHVRWVALLQTLGPAEWERGYRHPELGAVVALDTALGQYAWHGRHHVAHVTALRERMGW
jgi:hypothetical protein